MGGVNDYLNDTEGSNTVPPWPTCRTYPRTLYSSQGAFPRSPEYACALRKHMTWRAHRWADACIAVLFVIVAAAVIGGW